MPKVEEFKAAFLSKAKLAKKLGKRVSESLADINAARSEIAKLPPQNLARQQREASLTDLEQRVMAQVTVGTTNAGKAWCAMNALAEESATAKKDTADEVVREKGLQDERIRRFEQRLVDIRKLAATARTGKREIVNEVESKRIGDAIDDLLARTDNVARAIKATPTDCQKGYNQLEPLFTEAQGLDAKVQAAKRVAANPGSQRQASSEAVKALTTSVPKIGEHLSSTKPLPQGRTALQQVQAELEIFDERFALDPAKDPNAEVKNNAMRVAAIVKTGAREMTRELNDPALTPRIARSVCAEFEVDMTKALSDGKRGGDKGAALKARQEAQASVRLAEALVMDDPVTKLMTAKITGPDAVQRIRDMAQAAGVKPSEMLEMLRQQFEMQVGSASYDEVKKGTKGSDRGVGFVLSDLYGELSHDQLTDMVELSGVQKKVELNEEFDQPMWRDDAQGGGLDLKATNRQVHRVAAGDTLATLAQAYLNDASKTDEIVKLNKVVLVPLANPTADKRHDEVKLTGFKPDAQLPVGAVLIVPGQTSLLDQIAPYVAAFDTIEMGDGAPQPVAESPPSGPVKPPEGLVRPTARELRAGAKKLTSPKDMNRNPDDARPYIPAPGLGQDHRLTGALSDEEANTRAKRVKEREKRIDQLKKLAAGLDKLGPEAIDTPEFKKIKAAYDKLIAEDDRDRRLEQADARHGAVNERQYAHLRMLQRSDEEEKEQFLRDNGQSVEDWVLERMAKRYNVDAKKAKDLLDSALSLINKVPLTITFKAESLFSDPNKNEPAHGPVYASEVVYSRGREEVGGIIGRGDNVEDKVGVTGGKKTGWEKDRGENYMRWRTDKDDREGRHDPLAYEDQQIFGAANPNFEELKGGASGGAPGKDYGLNYYGDAHFLLSEAVRPRLAYAIRGGGISIGGGQSANQRKDLMMVVHDMLKGGESNTKYLDVLLLHAKKKDTVVLTGLDWEVHLYGGFDIRKDAKAIYLKPDLDKGVLSRIQAFTKKFGVECKSYGDRPDTLTVKANADPRTLELDQ